MHYFIRSFILVIHVTPSILLFMRASHTRFGPQTTRPPVVGFTVFVLSSSVFGTSGWKQNVQTAPAGSARLVANPNTTNRTNLSTHIREAHQMYVNAWKTETVQKAMRCYIELTEAGIRYIDD